MLINNTTPGTAPTLSEMQVGDVFVMTKFPDKILILTGVADPETGKKYGFVELSGIGVLVYEGPLGVFNPDDTVTRIKIESVNFKQI